MTDRVTPGERGRTNGVDHPTWENGTPILIGQQVRWHEKGYLTALNKGWPAVVHEVGCEEIRIGGMDAHDEEWEEQVHPDELVYSASETLRDLPPFEWRPEHGGPSFAVPSQEET